MKQFIKINRCVYILGRNFILLIISIIKNPFGILSLH